jgi:hypothetical protein
MYAAVSEAAVKAGLAGRLISMGEIPMDDSRSHMFPGAAQQDLGEIQCIMRNAVLKNLS